MGGRPDEPFTGDEIVCMMAASCVGVGTGEEHPLRVDISYKKMFIVVKKKRKLLQFCFYNSTHKANLFFY